jgi:hypothetical protein
MQDLHDHVDVCLNQVHEDGCIISVERERERESLSLGVRSLRGVSTPSSAAFFKMNCKVSMASINKKGDNEL